MTLSLIVKHSKIAHLREHNMLAKARKCELFETSIAFLKHVVYEESIAIDPKKIEKICNLSAPKDKERIRSILGLGQYYIKIYCVITAPLQELLKMSVHFRWDDEHPGAFIKLKEELCITPVLAYPDPNLPYVVNTDASNIAIGAVLSEV